jgi:hypothetical protein
MTAEDTSSHSDDGTEDGSDDGSQSGMPARQSGGPGLIVAISLAVVFAIAAIALGFVALGGDDGDGLDDLRSTAGQFAEALVTYDFHDPDAHRDAVLALATGSFSQDYQDAFDQGLSDIITEVQAVSTGTVNDVFLSSIADGQAQAVVSLDIAVSGSSGARHLADQYVLLTLVQLDDGWRVDQVTDLSFPSAAGSPSVTTDTSTATTAPPAAPVP